MAGRRRQPRDRQPHRHRHHRPVAARQRGRRREDLRLVGQHDRRDSSPIRAIRSRSTAGTGSTSISGFGDAFLSNAIFANGANEITSDNPVGIYLAPGSNQGSPPRASRRSPPTSPCGTTTIQGSYSSQASTRFLIQFFSNAADGPGRPVRGPDPDRLDDRDHRFDWAPFTVDVPTLVKAVTGSPRRQPTCRSPRPVPIMSAVENLNLSTERIEAINLDRHQHGQHVHDGNTPLGDRCLQCEPQRHLSAITSCSRYRDRLADDRAGRRLPTISTPS